MTNIEKIHIQEKLKRKNLEIKELEGQLRKQYDEVQELIKKLGKSPRLRKQTNGLH
jgi:hypothetical protein